MKKQTETQKFLKLFAFISLAAIVVLIIIDPMGIVNGFLDGFK